MSFRLRRPRLRWRLRRGKGGYAGQDAGHGHIFLAIAKVARRPGVVRHQTNEAVAIPEIFGQIGQVSAVSGVRTIMRTI
jgi:hypothetical protein